MSPRHAKKRTLNLTLSTGDQGAGFPTTPILAQTMVSSMNSAGTAVQ
jgi:hypothetical protein